MPKNLTVNVISAVAYEHNRKFKELIETYDNIESSIYDLEVKLSELYREKYKVQKLIRDLERKIMENIVL